MIKSQCTEYVSYFDLFWSFLWIVFLVEYKAVLHGIVFNFSRKNVFLFFFIQKNAGKSWIRKHVFKDSQVKGEWRTNNDGGNSD